MPNTPEKVYFSASIKGQNVDPELGYNIVMYLKSLGYDVLSEHVGSRNSEEMNRKLLERTGTDKQTLVEPEASQFIRKIDTEWVDEADFLVVLLTGASFGVGMEIERAFLKPERGLNMTPIYCFVSEENLALLSSMVRGITEGQFMIFTYATFADIQKTLDSQLTPA